MNITKYQIGSKLLGLANTRDSDYIILSDHYNRHRTCINGEDLLYCSPENLLEVLSFKSDNYRDTLYNYQLDQDIIKQNFPIEYHLLDYRKQLIILLKRVVKYKLFNFNKDITIGGKYCSSLLYHVAYNMFICQNNSVLITNDQKEIIQKIHDCKMPISYLNDMTEIITNLTV